VSTEQADPVGRAERWLDATLRVGYGRRWPRRESRERAGRLIGLAVARRDRARRAAR
jgi:hypothetical protein